MRRIQWIPVNVVAGDAAAALLFALLLAVVVRLAQTLPVGLIPEQHRIAFVRDAVVDDARPLNASVALAHDSTRIHAKESETGLLPLVGIGTRRRRLRATQCCLFLERLHARSQRREARSHQ